MYLNVPSHHHPQPGAPAPHLQSNWSGNMRTRFCFVKEVTVAFTTDPVKLGLGELAAAVGFEYQSKEPQPAPPSAVMVVVGFALKSAGDQLARSTTPVRQPRHMARSRTIGNMVVGSAIGRPFVGR
jgi:hypothetical protein